MLKTMATDGRQGILELSQTVFASGAPQFLQKLASGTTTGEPHWAQKRGRSKRGSGMEGEKRVAQPERVTTAKLRFGHSLAAYPGAVLAPQIAYHEAAVAVLDARMMA